MAADHVTDDSYQPASDFLKAVANDEAPLSGGEHGEANLRHLMTMTRDEDVSNRDWATMLLAQHGADTPEIRAALIHAATMDDNDVVRGEAILGLAQRDRDLALPLVQAALQASTICVPMLEAAALCADPSLIADLRIWAEPSDDPHVDSWAADALAACEAARDADSGEPVMA